MNHPVLEKRIPSLLGIILLLVGLAASSFIVKQNTNPAIKAGPTDEPQNLSIANITDSSVTISYTTVGNVTGVISYGTSNQIGKLALDIRDKTANNPASHEVHYITLANLQPKTTYYFAIISDGTKYPAGNKTYQATTADTLPQPSAKQLIIGKVILPDGTIPHEGVVTLAASGLSSLSQLIENDGTYTFNLSDFLTNSLQPAPLLSSELTLTASDGTYTSVVSLPINQKKIPTIVLAQNYNFSPLFPTSVAPGNIAALPTTVPESTSSPDTISVTTPTQNQFFNDQQPQFHGKAPSASILTITIADQNITDTVTTSANGVWQYRPAQPLSVGEHQFVISADQYPSVKVDFSILASGNQINESATPSATPTVVVTNMPSPTLILSPTIAISPQLSPTALPTAAPSLSPTSIPTATLIPTMPQTTLFPTATKVPTPSDKLGPGDTIVGVGLAGIILMIIGGLLFVAL